MVMRFILGILRLRLSPALPATLRMTGVKKDLFVVGLIRGLLPLASHSPPLRQAQGRLWSVRMTGVKARGGTAEVRAPDTNQDGSNSLRSTMLKWAGRVP